VRYQEIRYLLMSLLNDVEHTYIRVVRQRTVNDQTYLFTNGVLEVKVCRILESSPFSVGM